VDWEKLRVAMWESSLPPCVKKPATLFHMSEEFAEIDPHRYGKAPRAEALKLAEAMLRRSGVRRADREKTLKRAGLVLAGADKNITFLEWLGRLAPAYEEVTPDWIDLLPSTEGKLGLDPTINSFAQVREGTHVEFLGCGADAMMAMLREMKKAKKEILMSWFELCPEVPALRGERGRGAWDDPEGNFIPVVKKAAESGVSVRILLYDAPTALDAQPSDPRRTCYITKMLNDLHPNIEVMSHPLRWPFLWTHHQKFLVVDRASCVLGGIDYTVKRWDTPEHPMFDPDNKTHPGIDYSASKLAPSWYYADPVKRKEDLLDRQREPRLGWQDICVTVWGAAAEDCAFNFVERWNFARDNAPLLDEAFSDGKVDGTTKIQPFTPAEKATPVPRPAEAHGTMRAQIVRSAGPWSAGLDAPERSHYHAWIHAIASAHYYIYIEQQYFISDNVDSAVLNQVSSAIMQRVEAALAEKRKFRIFVVIPMKVTADAVSHFTRRSLLQGESSLTALLEKLLKGTGKDPSEYLSVCRLHQAAKSPAGEWKEATTFVHTKALIVDDRVAVIGSANINDRSFAGDRDSELGVILWDDEARVKGKMGGKDVLVGEGIRRFRKQLWKPMLGGVEVDDPISEDSYRKVWCATAAKNQKILESVFPWVPSNKIGSHGDWGDLREAGGAPEKPERLKDLKGSLTEFPRFFLGNVADQGWVEYFSVITPGVRTAFL